MDGGDHQPEESSSQRRERLLALRSAAGASPAGAPPPAPAGSLLPDPDLPGDQASCPRPRPPQRFDYYTNPAAAFSSSYSGGGATNPTWSHKRKSPPACYDPRPAPPPPAYAELMNYSTYYPPHQHHMAPASIQYPSLMQPGVQGSSLWRSPMQFQTPMPGYQGNPFGTPPPHFASPARCSYPNSPSFGGFRHTNPSQRSSHVTYGPRSSPYSSYRQRRAQNYCRSTASRGRGGGLDASSQNHSGWQYQMSYLKSMVDDPWMDLQPIVGNILIPMDAPSVEDESKQPTTV